MQMLSTGLLMALLALPAYAQAGANSGGARNGNPPGTSSGSQGEVDTANNGADASGGGTNSKSKKKSKKSKKAPGNTRSVAGDNKTSSK